MPGWLSTILLVVFFAVAILVVYNLLSTYVLSKLKVNKWIILAIGVFIFVLSNFFGNWLPGKLGLYIPAGLFTVFLLWFMDVSGYTARSAAIRENKNKPKTIIKPKAKPNRLKYTTDVIEVKGKKKKK